MLARSAGFVVLPGSAPCVAPLSHTRTRSCRDVGLSSRLHRRTAVRFGALVMARRHRAESESASSVPRESRALAANVVPEKLRHAIVTVAVVLIVQLIGSSESEAISLPNPFGFGGGGGNSSKSQTEKTSPSSSSSTAPGGSSISSSAESMDALSKALKQSGGKNVKLVENAVIDPLDERCANIQVDAAKFVRLTNSEQRGLVDDLLASAQAKFNLERVVLLGKKGEFLARAGIQVSFADGPIKDQAQITALKKQLEKVQAQSNELKVALDAGQEEVALARERLLDSRVQMDAELLRRDAENARLTQAVKALESKLTAQPELKSLESAFRAKEAENRRLLELTDDQMEAFENAKIKTQQSEELMKSLGLERAKIEKEAADRIAAAQAQLEKQIADNRVTDAARIKELEAQVVATQKEAAKETEVKLLALKKEGDAALAEIRAKLGDSEKMRVEMADAAKKAASKFEQQIAELDKRRVAAVDAEKKASEERLKKVIAESEKKAASALDSMKKAAEQEAKKLEAQLKAKDVAMQSAVKSAEQNGEKQTAAKLADLSKQDQAVISDLKKQLAEAEKAAEKRVAARFAETQKESQTTIAGLKKQLAETEKSSTSALASTQKSFDKQLAAKDQELKAKLAQADKDKQAELRKSADDFQKQLREQQKMLADTERARNDTAKKLEASEKRIEALEKKLAEKK
ncbi:hypothetical protein FVE85_2730 [Porphyridium purpureum]|uniref:Uncharacterized protein n=1 Tax=Porphyridium purpureum TaxID=35688 RepID=A0A5J4YST4_PORPP|nr:hypothetical protein FVE85_2730 [Porphyridium purpureum]|eukprot:POR5430..scf227_4